MMLNTRNVVAEMLRWFPQLKEKHDEQIEFWTDDDIDTHIILGNVLQPYLSENIQHNNDKEIFKIFEFLEEMSYTKDIYLKNVLIVSILEPCGPLEKFEKIWHLIGPAIQKIIISHEEYMEKLSSKSFEPHIPEALSTENIYKTIINVDELKEIAFTILKWVELKEGTLITVNKNAHISIRPYLKFDIKKAGECCYISMFYRDIAGFYKDVSNNFNDNSLDQFGDVLNAIAYLTNDKTLPAGLQNQDPKLKKPFFITTDLLKKLMSCTVEFIQENIGDELDSDQDFYVMVKPFTMFDYHLGTEVVMGSIVEDIAKLKELIYIKRTPEPLDLIRLSSIFSLAVYKVMVKHVYSKHRLK